MDNDFEQNFFRGAKILFLWGLCLLLNIITLFIVRYKLRESGDIVALRYNVVTGVNWYGHGLNLYILPTIGFLLTIVNFLLFRAFRSYQRFLSFLAIFVSLAVQASLLAVVLFLLRVN